jgi:polyisoprenyl-phosphate glycosyltransferase
MTSAPTPEARLRLAVVTPVYRDWESASLLCQALDEQCAHIPGVEMQVLLVDDGSPEEEGEQWEPPAPRWIRSIDVMLLRRNLGHQRAIATGLCHIQERVPCDAVLIMDADGEDRPEDAVRLVKRALEEPGQILFARRRKRLEGLVFRAGYSFYRFLHRILTGVPVSVGNFSVVPRPFLNRLVCMPELWNHYAGAVFKSQLPFDSVPIDRGQRYRGRSRMNLVSLVNHGLAGIATFQDVVATRILIAAVAGVLLTLAALAAVIGTRFFTGLAIPGWATYAAGLLLVLLLQLVALSFSLVFTLTANRANFPFLPSRDYRFFVEAVATRWPVSHESRIQPLQR